MMVKLLSKIVFPLNPNKTIALRNYCHINCTTYRLCFYCYLPFKGSQVNQGFRHCSQFILR